MNSQNQNPMDQLTTEKPIILNKTEYKLNRTLFLPKVETRQAEGGLRTKGYFKRNTFEQPLITVITVVFNSEKFLEETILSVIQQSYQNLEFIIIDGGSNDGTLGIIKKFDEKIDYWVSEKDNGIYDAMNKGISLSQGMFLIHINSGDRLFPDSILEMVPYFNSDCQLIFGPVKYKSGKVFYPNYNFRIYLKNSIHHQGAFYLTEKLLELGGYDTRYKILADYKINLLLYTDDSNTKETKNIITECLDNGISDTPRILNYLEEISIRNQVMNNLLAIPLNILTLARFSLKKIIRGVNG